MQSRLVLLDEGMPFHTAVPASAPIAEKKIWTKSMLELSKIRIDGGTQSRDKLNEDVVAEYAGAMKDGAQFPAITVFFDGADYWLADGFHRFFAAKKAGLSQFIENVIPGTKRDAVLHSLGANDKHGLRRSNADKRRSVLTMLNDGEWAGWSDNAIAKACAVHHSTVAGYRLSILRNPQDAPTTRTVERNGTTYTQNTANIGKAQPKPALAVVQQEPEYNPADDELAELSETVRTLAEERDALQHRINAGAIVGTEEEKTAALETMCSMRKEINRLEIENRALVASRDSYQRENGELKKQCAMYRKQLEKQNKAAA